MIQNSLTLQLAVVEALPLTARDGIDPVLLVILWEKTTIVAAGQADFTFIIILAAANPVGSQIPAMEASMAGVNSYIKIADGLYQFNDLATAINGLNALRAGIPSDMLF